MNWSSNKIVFIIHKVNIEISLSSESMTSIVHCLYSNYHFCTSQERYVFFESLFHIKFVGLNLFFILHVIDLLLNIYRDKNGKIVKTRTRVMIFCVTAHRWIKDHHHRKMGMLIVQNGCGWGGVFIFICLLSFWKS